MKTITQDVLPLAPDDAIELGPMAYLVPTPGGGGDVVINGMVAYAFTGDDEVGRRLAAVALARGGFAKISVIQKAFDITHATFWRWRHAFEEENMAGLIPDKKGPRGPSKLTTDVVDRIRALRAHGVTLAKIADQVGVSTAGVRDALGLVAGRGTTAVASSAEAPTDENGRGDCESLSADTARVADELPAVPQPAPRTGERALAQAGLLVEARVVFTPGTHLPLAGLLLILPALETTGLLDVFTSVYGRLRNGFYGLRSTVLTLVLLALIRQPRAEGLTRVNPADLGRVLGLDRAPEVTTLRRKLIELAGHQRGASVQAGLADAHAATRPDALGFLHVDGHTRAYFGTRDVPKQHAARLNMTAHASAETWICDSFCDPLFVVPGTPGASLAAELTGLLPELRRVIGPGTRATVVFDRGGWSPETFAHIISAGFDVLTYRKGSYEPLPAEAFGVHEVTDDDGRHRSFTLAEHTVELPYGRGKGKDSGTVRLRQIHKLVDGGRQIAVLTSRTDLTPAELVWRLAGRWRQENYFRYARQHYALDTLDTYADKPDDLTRLVPNPAKKTANDTVQATAAKLEHAQAGLDAATEAAAITALQNAHHAHEEAKALRRSTPSHVPLGDVRPHSRLLDEERKLLTHAIRMSAYNAESTLARMIGPYYARADDEARALIREALTLPGDITISDSRLHVRLNPATAPRRSRAIQALCQELTATETVYPDTNLTITYEVKDHPDHS